MLVDAVVGIISREQLPNVLTTIHRAGLGPQARVLDPDRGDVNGQLERAGVIDAPHFAIDPDSEMVLLVFTGGRMADATSAMERFGGRDIQTLGRRTTFAMNPTALQPTRRTDQRRPRSSSTRSSSRHGTPRGSSLD